MEEIKKRKTSQRTPIPNTLKNLISEGLGLDDIVVAFQLLKEEMDNLDTSMSEYFKIMFKADTITAKDIDKETRESDIYKQRFLV